MAAPHAFPIGLRLNQAARVVGQQFDRALGEAGGSLPVWLVLLSLTGGRTTTQRELAGLIGITEATLSHHLAAMERQGLVARARNETNRRVHDVAVTEAGQRLFRALREAAVAFDARLNDGLSTADRVRLGELLEHLVGNISDRPVPTPPWAGVGPAALAAQQRPAGRAGLRATPTEGPAHD